MKFSKPGCCSRVTRPGWQQPRISNAELHQLKSLLTTLADRIDSVDPVAAGESRPGLPLLVAQATRNSAVCSTIDWLWAIRNQSEISIEFHKKLRQAGSLPTYDDHNAILCALMQRDPEAAYQASHRHLTRVIEEFDTASLD